MVRRYGHFDLAEDAVQEALLAAAQRWPDGGVPDDPRAWLIAVAARRLTDLLRREQARRRREDLVVRRAPEPGASGGSDDSLVLLLMCCHPALSAASQIALTLRAVGGLTTAEIGRAFLVPEATMTRRISRAKQAVKDSGVPFGMPSPADRAARLDAVLRVLYLIFNEGYAGTSGPLLHRVELSAEAIRLARMVRAALPGDAEAAGLLALMLLTDARRPARTGPDGAPIPMAEQDRGAWERASIAEGTALLAEVLPLGRPGPYQLQAAIAALHDEAPSAAETDWVQIVALYELLMRVDGSPVVRLNHAVAVAMARGASAGLELLAGLEADRRIAEDHRFHAARAHLLETAGDRAGALESYRLAARRTTSLPQQRYLNARAARLAEQGHNAEATG